MNRRSVFHHALALFGIPSGLAANALSAPSVAPRPGPVPGSPPAPPPWLEEWLRLPLRPVIHPDELGSGVHPRVRQLASRILAGTNGGGPLTFRYHGGSDPGGVRSVHPVLLFRKFDPADPAPEPADRRAAKPLYLLAHCRTRGAARTFRVERIEWRGC